jgi:PAS domain S-box-containing protein
MAAEGPHSRNSKSLKICRSILDAVTEAILIFDPQSFKIIDVNKAATELYGYPRNDLLQKQLQDLTDDIPTYAELLQPTAGMEAVHVNSDGEKLDFRVSLSLMDYGGRRSVLSINRDIRELKRIQASVAANEKRFRYLVHNISEIVALVDPQGIVRFVSPQAERVLGLSVAEIVGHDVFDFIHPKQRARARQEYKKRVHEPGEAVPAVLRLRNSDGIWVPFEIIANNRIHEPDVGGVIFTARDLRYRRELEDAIRRSTKRFQERISALARANEVLRLENQQRRTTEKKLRESLSLLNATLESTADAILVTSTDGAVRSCNQKFLEMCRMPGSALATTADEDLLRWTAPEVDNPDFLKSTRKLYASPTEISFDIMRLKDGRIFERYSQPQKVGSEIRGRVWSFRDVSHAQRLQEEFH